jgi:hypothetical protein
MRTATNFVPDLRGWVAMGIICRLMKNQNGKRMIYVDAAVAERLERKAEEAGMDTASYVRQLVKDYVRNERTAPLRTSQRHTNGCHHGRRGRH